MLCYSYLYRYRNHYRPVTLLSEKPRHKMWGFNAYETATKPAKTFDVEDFLSSLFSPADAFVHAASLNQLEVVRRWISRGHDVNKADKEGQVALCAAAQNRCMEVMALLLDSAADVDQRRHDGKSALHIACTWGRFDAAVLLLRHGATASLRDNDGQVPLHGACRNGHDKIVALLLDAGIDPFLADDCGATPIDLAKDWQRPEILQTINEYHLTVFTALMRSRVRYVVRHRKPTLPASLQLHISSFLC